MVLSRLYLQQIDGPNDKADEVSSTTPEVPPGDVKTAIKPLTPVVRNDKEKLETNRLKDINIKVHTMY